MLKIILWTIVFYFIYKLIVDLIWPVTKTVSSMKKAVNQMQEQQKVYEQQFNNPSYNPQPKATSTNTTNTNSEYIDFEEVK